MISGALLGVQVLMTQPVAAADPVEKRIRIEIPDSEDDPGMLWNPLKVAVC